MYEYFMSNNLHHEKKFGFQINNSTEHAILQFKRDIAQNFENGKFTLGAFIDLSKDFDTVDYQILLKKLKHYGVDEKTLPWLQSYHFQRKQYIENTNNIKYLLEIDCGVPHGSISWFMWTTSSSYTCQTGPQMSPDIISMMYLDIQTTIVNWLELWWIPFASPSKTHFFPEKWKMAFLATCYTCKIEIYLPYKHVFSAFMTIKTQRSHVWSIVTIFSHAEPKKWDILRSWRGKMVEEGVKTMSREL